MDVVLLHFQCATSACPVEMVDIVYQVEKLLSCVRTG